MNDINIVLSADNNYAQHLCVTITSLLENNKNKNYLLKINILDGGINDVNKEKINTVCSYYNTIPIYYKINQEVFKNFPEIGHLKLPTYYRLIIPEIFPQEVNKIIYLDSDIIINGDIVELFKQDIENYVIGAVKDILEKEILDYWKKEKINSYFNAGILLINLKEWRLNNITEKCFLFINENKERLRCADQDALNIVCTNKWKSINEKFNLQINKNQKEVKNLEPIILHYVGKLKPWDFMYNNFYSKYYWTYLKQTPYKDYRRSKFNHNILIFILKDYIKKTIKKIPGVMLIKKAINKK